MKITFFVLLFFFFLNRIDAQISICSWNLKDFGKSKEDSEIRFIAGIVKDHDIVLIQEVVAKDPGGAQAVGRLGDVLQRSGAKWEYRISDATSGENSYKRERYAVLWKPSKVTLVGRPWLEQLYNNEINREPFLATFEKGSKKFTVVNFHAITKRMQPETEVKYFKFLPAEYPDLNLVFCGDWNLPQSHTVFNPLKGMGYVPVFTRQKTSLRTKCIAGDCLASELDNMFYNREKFKVIKSGIIPFFDRFADFSKARLISDHVPIYAEIVLN